MSSFKNNFECETTLMSTKQYYCLRGRNKNKIWSRMKLGGGGGVGAAVDLLAVKVLSLCSN